MKEWFHWKYLVTRIICAKYEYSTNDTVDDFIFVGINFCEQNKDLKGLKIVA